jgi:hypothetical protein
VYQRSWWLPVLLALGCSIVAADPVSVGYLSFDAADSTGSAGAFDVFNGTGENASQYPDVTFPVTTPLALSGFSLTIQFASGQVQVLDSTHFVDDGSGGLIGDDSFSLPNSPISSAILAGTIAPLNTPSSTLVLNDGSSVELLNSSFSTTFLPAAGSMLQIGDVSLINVETTQFAAVPEPSLQWLSTSALATVLLLARVRSQRRLFRQSAKSMLGLTDTEVTDRA